jgi:hypothetical protein
MIDAASVLAQASKWLQLLLLPFQPPIMLLLCCGGDITLVFTFVSFVVLSVLIMRVV